MASYHSNWVAAAKRHCCNGSGYRRSNSQSRKTEAAASGLSLTYFIVGEQMKVDGNEPLRWMKLD
uniref:Uncharacterized protein n=1 Tax=Physcomitrium patens TaxID=3218 RepID=A0A2K1JKA4_PHYPA|nr:hypothetical protein PHYPA_016814 [Physcomitrium patens]